MGRPKALLPLSRRGTALSVLADTLLAAGITPLEVIVGPWWHDRVLPAPLRIVMNPAPDRGQASSIRCGLEALLPETGGILIAPVDHPFVHVDTIRLLAEGHAVHPDAIVQPLLNGRRGHPVVFPSWAWPLLLDPALDAVGARAVVRAHAEMVFEVPVADQAIRMDFDTQEGYLRAEIKEALHHELRVA